MSEKTIIGGTTYESIGSSKSNLLLKCNGTARILWGNKLIDLIKNGKIASDDSGGGNSISIISDESEINTDGIYVLTKGDKSLLLICKNNLKYDLGGTDLYISASNKLNITVALQKQALENIGMYYETLEEVKETGILNGLVYITSTKELYTIKDGIVSEFEAKLKAITVEKVENADGEVINSSYKIVLRVADEDYLILENNAITVLQNLLIKNNYKIQSEGATGSSGYRLFVQSNESFLEVDNIVVRNGLPIKEYTEIKHYELLNKINKKLLKPLEWYLITDYQNYWRIKSGSKQYRPILVRALNNNTLYDEGFLFEDHSVKIHYDPTYNINMKVGTEIENIDGLNVVKVITILSPGRITWMKDSNNNEANFDFLDYYNKDGELLTTLHYDGKHYSIFPVNSYNNTIIAEKLFGTDLIEYPMDFYNPVYYEISTADNYKINFTILDSVPDPNKDNLPVINPTDPPVGGGEDDDQNQNGDGNGSGNEGGFTPIPDIGDKEFEDDNELDNGSGSNSGSGPEIITPGGDQSLDPVSGIENFTDTQLNQVSVVNEEQPYNVMPIGEDNPNLQLISKMEMHDNYIKCNGFTVNSSCLKLINTRFNNITNTTISKNIINGKFGNVDSCHFNCSLEDVSFKNLKSCNFIATITIEDLLGTNDVIKNVNCRTDLTGYTFNKSTYLGLYNPNYYNEIYYESDFGLQITDGISDFRRGMIVMHAGMLKIPDGWAVCDGLTYTYNGVTTTTPNLTGKFIKAVTSNPGAKTNSDVTSTNTFTITELHLPQHSHPHSAHNHTIYGLTGTLDESDKLSVSLDNSNYVTKVTTTTKNVAEGDSDNVSVVTKVETTTGGGSSSGGVHSHNISILGGIISPTTSTESTKTWTNKAFCIEPLHYALIFIMKL